jgi:phosphate transport system protein
VILQPEKTILEELQQRLLEMGGLVETAIHDSMQALARKESETARQVVALEEVINRLEVENDSLILGLLGQPHPDPVELRFLIVAIKINHDLERMGDLAANNAQRALALMEEQPVKPLIDIPRMAQLAESMVGQSLDSFVKRDAELARAVLANDDGVDGLRDSIYEELVRFMQDDPDTVSRALSLLFVARNLERIADHATNIAEDVLFLVEGIDVRHHT